MIWIGLLRTLAPLALLVLVGCAGPRALERDLEGEPLVATCLESYQLIDDAVASAGVRDVEAHRVPDFPYLRVNRFLASFSEQDLSPARLEAWVEAADRSQPISSARVTSRLAMPCRRADGATATFMIRSSSNTTQKHTYPTR